MRRTLATRLRSAGALALVCATAGCSLLSLDDLQGGASNGGSTSVSSASTTSVGTSSTGTVSGGSTSSVGGSTTGTASSSASSGTGGAGDDAYVAAILADGPTAWYRLAEGAMGDAAVDQIAMKNGVYEGTGTPLAFGVPSPFANTSDTAVNFLGGRVTVTHPELAVYDGAFSMEAWIDAATIDTNHRAIVDVEWADGVEKQGYRMYVYTVSGAPRLLFGRVNAAADQEMSVAYPNDGQYHHVVATYNGTTGLCIFIDAVSTCTTQAKIILDNAPVNVLIGARPFGTSSTTFRGSIDEVTLWDKALTGAQVTAHFQARNP